MTIFEIVQRSDTTLGRIFDSTVIVLILAPLSANMPETPAPDGISVGRGGENR